MAKSIAHHSSIIILVIFLLLPGCIHKREIDKQILRITPEQVLSDTTTTPPAITIWIHGTVFFTKPSNFELYHQNPTLVKATQLPQKSRFRRIAEIIVKQDPYHFSLQEFYIFCWSGHFSIRERKAAAKKLYHELIELSKKYEETYNQKPIIRIIAHSHGGNLALHMAKIKNVLEPLTIQSLILLACPVQEKTMHLIETPMFKRIYSLYSSFDLIQVLAPQLKRSDPLKLKGKRGYKIPTFSSRLFPQHPHVIQAKIKIDDFPITHSYFSKVEFAELLPKILYKLDAWDTQDLQQHMLHKYKLLCIYKRKHRKNHIQ